MTTNDLLVYIVLVMTLDLSITIWYALKDSIEEQER